MPDMSVALVWLPNGRVGADAGIQEVEAQGDDGLRDAVDADDGIWGWGNDLLNDIAVYEREPSRAPLGDLTPSQVAGIFVRALSLAADPAAARRGLLTRIDLHGDGVILAAGGELGGETPISFATLYAATAIFPSVAAAMGAVAPDRWSISLSEDDSLGG